MNYTDIPSLEAFLAAGIGGHWPLHETCTTEEAAAKVAVHIAAGRKVVPVLNALGTQTGWHTLIPAPVEVPDGTPPLERWDGEFERPVVITFAP